MQELRKLPDQTTHQQSLQPLHLELLLRMVLLMRLKTAVRLSKAETVQLQQQL